MSAMEKKKFSEDSPVNILLSLLMCVLSIALVSIILILLKIYY